MRRLLLMLGAAVVVGAMAVPALAQVPTLNMFLYVDTVNGTRPAPGTAPRPVGCSHTNVFKRGEQVVFRVWGSLAESGEILSSQNVKYAYVKTPGLPNLKLNWGGHGATTNRVWFWANAYLVPADYPLGNVTARIVFKTEDGKFGLYDYDMTILPSAAKKR